MEQLSLGWSSEKPQGGGVQAPGADPGSSLSAAPHVGRSPPSCEPVFLIFALSFSQD